MLRLETVGFPATLENFWPDRESSERQTSCSPPGRKDSRRYQFKAFIGITEVLQMVFCDPDSLIPKAERESIQKHIQGANDNRRPREKRRR